MDWKTRNPLDDSEYISWASEVYPNFIEWAKSEPRANRVRFWADLISTTENCIKTAQERADTVWLERLEKHHGQLLAEYSKL